MSVLFGHPGGNPNSHHAALAHYEAGRLAAFCVPWMPTTAELAVARCVPGFGRYAERLARRSFAALAAAPKIESRRGEWGRMARRMLTGAAERVEDGANVWLMQTMKRECRRSDVTAVHSYEDCAQAAFAEARRLGKACIYDLPIGYYGAWECLQSQLTKRWREWLPDGAPVQHVSPLRERKLHELRLADVVLAPSRFVARTLEPFYAGNLALCAYGVDADFWHPPQSRTMDEKLRFLYAGACSLRKGTPLLIEAWRKAGLRDARLELAGSWHLAASKTPAPGESIRWIGPLGPKAMRARYQAGDVFVFPSYFEGFGLVLLEAMACGLPAIASDATAGPEVLDPETGITVPSGDLDALVHALRWFGDHRDKLSAMQRAARERASVHSWERYRSRVTAAVARYVG